MADRSATGRSLAAEVLDGSGSFRFRGEGTSMVPFIRPGDVLHVVSGTTARVGDVVLRERQDGGWLVHRVVERRADFVVTRGDNCRGPDPSPSVGRVLGVVDSIERSSRVHSATHGPRVTFYRWLAARSVLGRPVIPLATSALAQSSRALTSVRPSHIGRNR